MVVKRLKDATDFALVLGVFDIRDFGAVIDGTTDDAGAVADALDAAIDAGGGVIYFPPGTTALRTGIGVDTGAAHRGVYEFRGHGSSSKIRFLELGNAYGIDIANANTVMFRDITLAGGIAAGISDTTTDVNYAAIRASVGEHFILDNVLVAGLKTTYETDAFISGGVIHCNGGSFIARDVVFGACTTPNDGVLRLKNAGSCQLRNVYFVDYLQLDDAYYNKLSIAGNTQNWVRATTDATEVVSSGAQSQKWLDFRNVRMDENTTESLIYAVGNSELSVSLEAVALSGGFGGGVYTSAIFEDFRKVTLRDCWNGININPTDFESFKFTDVAMVDIDNLLHKYGAKYITLAGTTGKLLIRNSRLQGNGTHTTGVNNTAGATVDASPALPNQL